MSESRCHLPTALVIVLQGLAHIAMEITQKWIFLNKYIIVFLIVLQGLAHITVHCIGRGNHPEIEKLLIYYCVFKKQNCTALEEEITQKWKICKYIIVFLKSKIWQQIPPLDTEFW